MSESHRFQTPVWRHRHPMLTMYGLGAILAVLFTILEMAIYQLVWGMHVPVGALIPMAILMPNAGLALGYLIGYKITDPWKVKYKSSV